MQLNAILYRLFPFLRWLPELRQREVLRADLVAGVTVALILIPQSMAYAKLAGLPPVYGLYAAFLPPVVAALFGSSRHLATGPVAMASLISAATVQNIAPEGSAAFIAIRESAAACPSRAAATCRSRFCSSARSTKAFSAGSPKLVHQSAEISPTLEKGSKTAQSCGGVTPISGWVTSGATVAHPVATATIAARAVSLVPPALTGSP